MTSEDLQLLREFRAEIPAPDERTRRRIYAYATSRSASRWQPSTRFLGVPGFRLRFAVPVAAVICAAVGAVVFTGALGGSGGHRPSSPVEDAVSPPTLAHPLPSFAKQTTLADAPTALGGPVVLPNSAVVGPSDAGPVWVASLTDQQTGESVTTVAVTFPSQGMVVEYTRPAPSDGTAAHFEAMAQSMVSGSGVQIGHVITLSGGVPALAVEQNADETGSNFGEIIFNVGGNEIRVMGHNDQATLQGVAQSILDRSNS
jgi:hypothetical protein